MLRNISAPILFGWSLQGNGKYRRTGAECQNTFQLSRRMRKRQNLNSMATKIQMEQELEYKCRNIWQNIWRVGWWWAKCEANPEYQSIYICSSIQPTNQFKLRKSTIWKTWKNLSAKAKLKRVKSILKLSELNSIQF